jgi:hypothetical protein
MGGPLSGGIWAKVGMSVGSQYTGCKMEYTYPQHYVACSQSYGPTLLPGPSTIGFHIAVADPASGEAKLQWLVNAPGSSNPTDANCRTSFTAHPPREKTEQTEPLSRLLSTEPQTYEFTQAVHLDQDDLGTVAAIDYDWTYSITVQRS